MVMPPLKYTCTTCLLQCFLDALTQAFGIRNHHVGILVVIGVVSRIVVASSVIVLGWSLGLNLNSVESPCRVLAFCKNFV